MATKAEMADSILALMPEGSERPDPDKFTADELAEMLAKAELDAAGDQGEPQPELKRHKVNRGSRRRIERALKRFDADVDAFIKEMDLQCFMADENGNRVGDWPMVQALRDMKGGVRAEINGVLTVGNEPEPAPEQPE